MRSTPPRSASGATASLPAANRMSAKQKLILKADRADAGSVSTPLNEHGDFRTLMRAYQALRRRYHSALLSRLAFCAFNLLLDNEAQLRTPIAVMTASLSSASSECLSSRLCSMAIASWYSMGLCGQSIRLRTSGRCKVPFFASAKPLSYPLSYIVCNATGELGHCIWPGFCRFCCRYYVN